MGQLPQPALRRLNECLAESVIAANAGETALMWQLLEDAHVLSQPSGSQHMRIHLRMLRAGWLTRDGTEVRGQLIRLLVAVPGSWSGRYPPGNTGRARVSATQPMPIRPDLEVLLSQG